MTITRADANEPRPRQLTWIPDWAADIAFVPFTLYAPVRHGRRPAAAGWPQLGDGLRVAGYLMRELPDEHVATVIETAAARWTDHAFAPRRAVLDAATRSTGMPVWTLQRLFDAELAACRRDVLLSTLRARRHHRHDQEPAAWHGTAVTLGMMSGAVPGSIVRTVTRILLGGSAVLARVPSREPGFAAAFLRSIHAVEPLVADAVVVTYWRRDDTTALRHAVEQADSVCFDG
ncbi:acyl-CoA reductase [Paractinoplanes hotanensis]|uniref:Uncharacterized protein n=1 Tax=Paractinoplanes hotanensis TaxID=2906497 RepID=A0ABT0Y9X7_9ACTN|nr:acyl-CoA reductase [Actinoplanes hotanensis]MCM4082308.1 hypothetical protein [Actinoplanes hotanensis]